MINSGIPEEVYIRLRDTLAECGPFSSDQQLRAVFAHASLSPWRNRLPEANSITDRVDAIMAFLIRKHQAGTQANALVLLLEVLRDQSNKNDSCYTCLAELTDELKHAFQARPSPERTRHSEEANPGNQQMVFTAEWIKLLECARAVGNIMVPKILRGRNTEQVPSGTGWLITPDLALTCWHVIKARAAFDPWLSQTDLNAQVTNSMMIFDYILPGEGFGYSIKTLELYDIDLDYALIRLNDRPDHPLRELGTLLLDMHVPLTIQTSLCIVQHPKSQPQQNSSGRFIKYLSDDRKRILHSVPTEFGTSGAPVLNIANWRVVALHNGENKDESLREATLLKDILFHIQQSQRDLYDEIMTFNKER